jgi:putative sterol carrier protein
VTLGDTDGAADAEATADAQTWALIVGGTLSPLEAFARGRLRLRGSMPVARNVARQLYGQDRQARGSDA